MTRRYLRVGECVAMTARPGHVADTARGWARHTAFCAVALGPDGIAEVTHEVRGEHDLLCNALCDAEILSVDALEEALENGSIRDVPHIGLRSAEKLRDTVRDYRAGKLQAVADGHSSLLRHGLAYRPP
jgi:hypothetical protein